MKKFIFLIILVISSLQSSFSQTSLRDGDHTKYWFYRWRLTNLFLKRGLNPDACQDPQQTGVATGFSIPAGEIQNKDGYNDTLNPFKEIMNGRAGMHWGDAVGYTGLYIGVLATEWRLLKNAGQPTKFVEEELYYAMKAYEYLDTKSGVLFYPKIASTCG